MDHRPRLVDPEEAKTLLADVQDHGLDQLALQERPDLEEEGPVGLVVAVPVVGQVALEEGVPVGQGPHPRHGELRDLRHPDQVQLGAPDRVLDLAAEQLVQEVQGALAQRRQDDLLYGKGG